MSLDLQARRHKNASAPIAILPFELVSLIFEHAAASVHIDEWNMKFLPALKSTCSFFHHVAVSTPCLWTRIQYANGRAWGDPPLPGQEPDISRLAAYLDRSGTLDFHLHITMGRMRHDYGGMSAKLRALLLAHFHRCLELYVDARSTAELEFMLPLHGNMPKLELLSLHVGDMQTQDNSRFCLSPSLIAPKLYVIRSNYPLFSDDPHALIAESCPPSLQKSLVQLDIESDTADISVLLIAASGLSHLINLKLTSNVSLPSNTTRPNNLLHFPRLRALSMDTQSVDSDNDGIESVHYIHAPRLRLLEFRGEREEVFVPIFCLGSVLPKLEVVVFRECYPDMDGFEVFLDKHQSIRALSLFVDTESKTWLDEFGEMLARSSSDDATFKPNLPLLTILQCECYLDDAVEAEPLMLRMAKITIDRVQMDAPILVNWINHEYLDMPPHLTDLECPVWSWDAEYRVFEDQFTFDED